MKKILRLTIAVGVALIIWQLLIDLLQIPDFLLPSPIMVLSSLIENFRLIAHHALITLLEIVLGYLGGIVFGCCTGLLIAFYQPLNRWFLPVLIMSQAIPTFAIAPLIVVWVGYGMSSKIITTILMIFFPITSALYDGLKNTNQTLLDLVSTMDGKKWRVFLFIRLPAALPALASGLRIAAVVAPIGAIVGEWVGASQGLGYLMLNANARLQMDMMFAVLLVIISIDLILYACVDRTLNRLIWWKTL